MAYPNLISFVNAVRKVVKNSFQFGFEFIYAFARKKNLNEPGEFQIVNCKNNSSASAKRSIYFTKVNSSKILTAMPESNEVNL